MKPSAGQLRVASSSASHVRGHKCPLDKSARTGTNIDDTQRESITSMYVGVHSCTDAIDMEAGHISTSRLWSVPHTINSEQLAWRTLMVGVTPDTFGCTVSNSHVGQQDSTVTSEGGTEMRV